MTNETNGQLIVDIAKIINENEDVIYDRADGAAVIAEKIVRYTGVGHGEDNIEKPQHYTSGSIEAIDYMRDSMDSLMFMGYLEGAIKKYLHRYRYKGKPVEDLRKAKWYLDMLIKEMEGE